MEKTITIFGTIIDIPIDERMDRNTMQRKKLTAKNNNGIIYTEAIWSQISDLILKRGF